MSILVLFAGQSGGNGLFLWPTSEVPRSGTFMWNGDAFVTPTGSGAIAYCNYLKSQFPSESIYIVNACVDGLPLIGPTSWTSPGVASAAANAIAKTQQAITKIPNCQGLDRVEFYGCQTDCIAPAYADMYGGIINGFDTLIDKLRTGLGNGFRFCIWPVGSVSTGSMTQVVRAQVYYSTCPASFAANVEVGPASYERLYSDGNHLLDGAQYAVMGRRAALNAASYFVAKANNALSIPHYGAGPQIKSITRGGAANRLLINLAVKNGFGIQTADVWGSSTNSLTGFGMWWGEGSRAQLPVIGTYLLGSIIAIDADQGLAFRGAVGNHWERGLEFGASVYDTRGQPLVQHTSELLVSN